MECYPIVFFYKQHVITWIWRSQELVWMSESETNPSSTSSTYHQPNGFTGGTGTLKPNCPPEHHQSFFAFLHFAVSSHRHPACRDAAHLAPNLQLLVARACSSDLYRSVPQVGKSTHRCSIDRCFARREGGRGARTLTKDPCDVCWRTLFSCQQNIIDVPGFTV